MTESKIFIINGQNINSLEEFHDEVQNVLCPKFTKYGRNWHAFNDILRGGFLSFELGEKIIIIFKNKRYVEKRLGEGFFNQFTKVVGQNDNVELKFD
ncbi:MAG: barstar family protein [Candidatus Heimdallarchaeota archaeon]